MVKKLLLLLGALSFLLILSGCAGMADVASKMGGLGVVTVDKSTFDNATIVEVSPTWLYDPDGSWGNRVKLGARWSSAAPNFVALVLAYSSDTSGYSPVYIGLEGIQVNIDDEKSSFSSGKPTQLDSSSYNSISRTIYTESRNSVVMPYSVLQRMVSAKDVRLRILTSKGYEDAVFSIERMPGGQGTAILSIREFLEKVNELRS